MKLYMPTKVYNEKGCVRQHSQELAELGTKALLVTGKHSSRVNGSLQDVEDALNREQVPYVIFDGIEENPSVETVMRATALGLSEKVDFVIGIGGGSPMDASKAIALMIANPEKKADFLYETDAAVKQAANKALTVAAVPTTAGTGSEVTPYAILTRIVRNFAIRSALLISMKKGGFPVNGWNSCIRLWSWRDFRQEHLKRSAFLCRR